MLLWYRAGRKGERLSKESGRGRFCPELRSTLERELRVFVLGVCDALGENIPDPVVCEAGWLGLVVVDGLIFFPEAGQSLWGRGQARCPSLRYECCGQTGFIISQGGCLQKESPIVKHGDFVRCRIPVFDMSLDSPENMQVAHPPYTSAPQPQENPPVDVAESLSPAPCFV